MKFGEIEDSSLLGRRRTRKSTPTGCRVRLGPLPSRKSGVGSAARRVSSDHSGVCVIMKSNLRRTVLMGASCAVTIVVMTLAGLRVTAADENGWVDLIGDHGLDAWRAGRRLAHRRQRGHRSSAQEPADSQAGAVRS